ncbi:MAG: DUF1788 domain-containing protein [Treponema sp.]
MKTEPLADRVNKIQKIIRNPDFLKNKGLGNEVGYYIFDYDPKDELLVRNHVKALRERFNTDQNLPDIHEFDLYEIIIELLQSRGYLTKAFKMEEISGSEQAYKAVRTFLRLNDDQEENLIINHIIEHAGKDSIVFITGVGKAYPLVRSHTILNNLHQRLCDVPVVLFFPGEYTGQKLRLFNTITDDNYYRAFKLC